MNKYILPTLTILFLLVGCGIPSEGENTKRVDDKTTKDVTNTIAIEEAIAIVLEDIGVTGEVTKQKEDYDDGILYYEIDVVNDGMKYEYKIDTTGTIIAKEQEVINTKGSTGDTYISSQEAQDIILEHAAGGIITSCELEIEMRAIYEIELVKDNTEYNAAVDATSGEVLYYNVDY